MAMNLAGNRNFRDSLEFCIFDLILSTDTAS